MVGLTTMGPERVLRAADDERSTADKVLMLYAPTFLSLAIFFVSIAIKRKWHDDVVFRNQQPINEKVQKRFINDTIRNDFHKRFLAKYIQ